LTGTSIWNVLDMLRESKTQFPQVDIKFDPQSALTSPIILHIRPHIDLLFSGLGQRLYTIAIRRLRPVNNNSHSLIVRYREQVISAPSVMLRRASVGKIFGPTYAGDALRFPGMWFSFEEDGHAEGGLGKKSEERDRDRLQEVKRIIVCQRPVDSEGGMGGEGDALDEVGECPILYGDLRRAVVKVSSWCSSHSLTAWLGIDSALM
jgi:hypothetical protein